MVYYFIINLFVLGLAIFCAVQVELHVCEHCLTKTLEKEITVKKHIKSMSLHYT